MSVASAPRARGTLLVLVAAALWATIGIIYSRLAVSSGLPPLAVAAARAGLGGLLLLVGLALFRPSALRVGTRALSICLLYGVVGIALFYATYVYAVLSAGVAVASVLLYTAPAWVALIAWRFLGERLTRAHAAALVLTLTGAALVAGVSPSGARIGPAGVLWGLGAGVTYALWSVLNAVAVRHVSPWTFQCYGMLSGGAVLLLLQPLAPLAWAVRDPGTLVWLAALAVGPTVGASLAYSTGVRSVPVSVASLIATLEPVIASLLAAWLLAERLGPAQIAGGALILAAVWMLRPRLAGA